MKKQTPLEDSPDSHIIIKGARVHNLKNISLKIPRDKLITFTGLSGSGKSSLAFDTLYAEGQRRYIESLSSYARQFLDQLSKPDVDLIEGLSPTISIEQKTSSSNPRSTVGTVTELWDYLRLLYSRVATPYCYQCGNKIESQTPSQITDQIFSLPENSRIAILSPIVRGRKGEYQKELLQLRQRGFVRVRVDGVVYELSEEIKLDKNKKHNLEVYIDRIIIKGDKDTLLTRVSESVDLALKLSGGLLILEKTVGSKTEESLLSETFACNDCGISYPAPEPRTFSFNSPMGACPTCEGLGTQIEEVDIFEKEKDPEAVVFKEEKTSESHPCEDCKGQRLKKESLHYKIGSLNIAQLASQDLQSLHLTLTQLSLTSREKLISERILKELLERIGFLISVGVSYLSVSRSASTLSGGEAQRLRLATQLGAALVGVIYILDEPSIGLHQRDNDKLISTLKMLRDMGNTVIVVEHDEDTIKASDYIVDLGPRAGVNGGEVTGAGTYSEFIKSPRSLTAQYLSGKLKIEVPKNRRKTKKDYQISLKGCSQNNLKKIDVDFPLGVFSCVTGVSGSGKSTLVIDTLYRLCAQKIYHSKIKNPELTSYSGLEHLDKVIDIDQSPIGRTPRSNPATYTGVFGFIRDLYAKLPEAQARGYKPGRFSFNVQGGRCETCEGDGVTKVVMHFMPDVYVECETCRGLRYNKETLDIRYKGKNISEVLKMSMDEALVFFDAVPYIKSKLLTMVETGLGYITLGQSATTLSGGEAQRIKLSKELSKRATGKTLYILDEPSTGLHFDDIQKLIRILQRLVDQGNTVIVIEHNLDLIKVADHIIDVGPEAGAEGGHIVVVGTPEQIAAHKKSHTGKYLKPYLT